MLNDISSFIDSLFNDPIRATAAGLLFLFIYLYVAKRRESEKLRVRLNEEKQTFYIDLFIFLNKVVRHKIDVAGNKRDMEKLIELDSKLKLFSNDNVVIAWADFWHSLFLPDSDPKRTPQMIISYGYLQLAVRKDLGSSRFYTNLKWFDFPRSAIKDLDDYLDEAGKELRTVEMRQQLKKSSRQIEKLGVRHEQR